jgi:predicted helicase
LKSEYEQGWKITEIVPVNSVGIVTARDSLTIHWSKDEILRTISDFVSLLPEEARQKYNLGKDVRDWRIDWAQEDIRKHQIKDDLLKPILYRPFDTRYTYYTGQSRGFMCMPRGEVMKHMLHSENHAFITSRNLEVDRFYDQFFCTDTIIQHHTLSIKEVNYLFPIYEYRSANTSTLFDEVEGEWAWSAKGRRPNLNMAFVREMESKLGLTFTYDDSPPLYAESTPPLHAVERGQGGEVTKTFTPEDIFAYAYAVFHSNEYRERYAEFLKIDFPRLPLTGDVQLFWTLVGCGKKLVDLHLLRGDIPMGANFPEKGDGVVSNVRYDDKTGRVYINKTQYFEGIEPDVSGVGEMAERSQRAYPVV